MSQNAEPVVLNNRVVPNFYCSEDVYFLDEDDEAAGRFNETAFGATFDFAAAPRGLLLPEEQWRWESLHISHTSAC